MMTIFLDCCQGLKKKGHWDLIKLNISIFSFRLPATLSSESWGKDDNIYIYLLMGERNLKHC